MTLDAIEALLRAAQNRGLALFEYAEGGMRLRMSFEAPGAAQPRDLAGSERRAAAPAAAPRDAVTSPGVGFFRSRHPAGGAEIGEGEKLAVGAVVGFIQAGPILQPVVAPRAGVLGPKLVADGAGVGFGTPLFALG